MRDFVRVMKALSDPNRVRIINLLSDGELCVCELTALLNVAQPTVSKHLRVLEDAGLVLFRKEGNWIIYRLNEQCQEVGCVMLGLVGQWLSDSQDIRELKGKLPKVQQMRRC